MGGWGKVEEPVHSYHMFFFFSACMCGPYGSTELSAVDSWEVKGEGEEGEEEASWVLNPGRCVLSVFFDPTSSQNHLHSPCLQLSGVALWELECLFILCG